MNQSVCRTLLRDRFGHRAHESTPRSVPTPRPTRATGDRPFDEGGALLSRGTGVACPSCQQELQIGTVADCQFAGCPQCQGMLLQQDVFARLLQHLRSASSASVIPKPIDLSELEVRRRCPGCEKRLETHAFGGAGNAVIDSCFRCQLIWLDRGEFSKLVHAAGSR